MSTVKDEAIKLRKNIDTVYEAGQNSMVDESKIIEKTATGKGYVILNDVSEIPHDISVQLSSNTITDFSGVTVTRFGKNLFDFSKVRGSVNNLVFTETGFSFARIGTNSTSLAYYTTYLQAGTYHIKADCLQSDGLNGGWGIYDNETGTYIENNSSRGTVDHTFTITESKEYRIDFFCNYSSADGTTATYSNIQLEFGSTATDYEACDVQIITANANGTVNDIKHISNVMILNTNTTNIDISASYHKSWGMQAEYDRFWDDFQQNGNRQNYMYAFAGSGWTEEIHKPKYPITIVETATTNRYVQSMFSYRGRRPNNPVDMTEICKMIDFSGALTTQQVFSNSRLYNITVDFSSSTSMYLCFNCSDSGETNNITIKITEKCTNFQGAFNRNRTITDITFTDDSVIAASIDFSYSPLTVASMKSVINALKNYSGTNEEHSYSVKFTDDCWAALEADSTAPNGDTWKNYVFNTLCWNY